MITIRRLQWTMATLVAGLLACGSAEPGDPASPLAGHFVVNNPFAISGFAMGLSLRVSGTTVSGYGWLGGLEDPLTPLSVTGQFNDPDFTLTLATLSGFPEGTITGSASTAGVQGSYVRGIGVTPVSVTLVRADTGASGRHTSTVSGSVTEQPSSSAGFYVDANGFHLNLAYPNRNFPLATLGRSGGRPTVGSYTFGGGSGLSGSVVPAYMPNQRFFNITSGTLRIDVSTPYAVIGQLTVQAQEAGSSATLSLTAQFSAGCMSQSCS